MSYGQFRQSLKSVKMCANCVSFTSNCFSGQMFCKHPQRLDPKEKFDLPSGMCYCPQWQQNPSIEGEFED